MDANPARLTCPQCGALEWSGNDSLIVAGTPGDNVEQTAHKMRDVHPSDPDWTCLGCGHKVARPSRLQATLDAVID